jgi:hypothetical protein
MVVASDLITPNKEASMPRRQRFKPSRKPPPAIENESEVIQPTKTSSNEPSQGPSEEREQRTQR